jgi:hypothetical protein
VLAAVNQNGWSLDYASDRLKDNEEFVLVAVNQKGRYLAYVSDRLKDDKAVVLASVSKNGYALRHASDRLRRDVNFCIECAKKNPDSIAYFLGEAKDLFEAYNNDVIAVEEVYTQQQQNKANEALLAKLTTGEMTVPTNSLFKRKLLNV